MLQKLFLPLDNQSCVDGLLKPQANENCKTTLKFCFWRPSTGGRGSCSSSCAVKCDWIAIQKETVT